MKNSISIHSTLRSQPKREKSARRLLFVYWMIGGLLLIGGLLPPSYAESNPLTPDQPIRMIAEWEPALGTMIAWPLGLPTPLVQELAKDDLLYFLHPPDKEAEVKEYIRRSKIDPEHVRYLPCSVHTPAVRDYGPHQIFDRKGQWAIVDHIFQGWPLFPADISSMQKGNTIEFPVGNSTEEDIVCREIASQLKAPVYDLPIFLVGGNFLVDGHGTAFCSESLVWENFQRYNDSELRSGLAQMMGIDRLFVLKNIEKLGIQHIDCWFKLLDEERILVKRPPEGNPVSALIEKNLEILRKLRTPYGRPYEILFIDCPEIPNRRTTDEPHPEQCLAAYTNSLILNRKILVPLFGIPGDQQAIQTWQEAMPGYKIVGITWKNWFFDDAIHCGVKSVFDAKMLYMAHPRLPSTIDYRMEGYPITVTIKDYSEAGLKEDNLYLNYRLEGQIAWQKKRLIPLYNNDQYTATIPSYKPASTVEYYIQAKDKSGRQEQLPRTAPNAAYRFFIDQKFKLIQ